MGMAHNGEYLYLASEYDYLCHYVEYCVSDSSETFLAFSGVSGDLFDIAYDSGYIWLAWSNPAQPIQKFDIGGYVIDFIPGTVIGSVEGLTMDDAGYLWASSMTTDSIYRISLETSLENKTWGGMKHLWFP